MDGERCNVSVLCLYLFIISQRHYVFSTSFGPIIFCLSHVSKGGDIYVGEMICGSQEEEKTGSNPEASSKSPVIPIVAAYSSLSLETVINISLNPHWHLLFQASTI